MRIYLTFQQKSQEILLLSFAKADIIKSDSETTTLYYSFQTGKKYLLRQTLTKQEGEWIFNDNRL